MIRTVFSLLVLVTCSVPALCQDLPPAEARAIAKEAYIYGYPVVDNYRIQFSYFVDSANPEYKGPFNRLYNTARVYTPDDKAIQSPNSDTPYSWLGADLRAEPLVITVPDVDQRRYYSLQFIDWYTFNFAYVGSRATGNGAGSYLLAGPNWAGEKPDGIKSVIRSETQFAFVIFRTQLFSPDDIDNVKKVQGGYEVQTLSRFLGQPAPAAAPPVDFVKPLSREEERTSLAFFDELNWVLQFCPTHPAETGMMARFAMIGIGAGRKFDADKFSPDVRQAMEGGIADAWKAYDDGKKQLSEGTLTSDELIGTREFVKGRYLNRLLATDGIYGNSRDEAFYPVFFTDSAGRKMDGSHRYTLTFSPNGLPPVNAFWSLTLYELPASLLHANSLDRYLINSPMLSSLEHNPDGSITIYVQNQTPGGDKEANWLPAPKGPFWAALRLYWPKAEALDRTWAVPKMIREE